MEDRQTEVVDAKDEVPAKQGIKGDLTPEQSSMSISKQTEFADAKDEVPAKQGIKQSETLPTDKGEALMSVKSPVETDAAGIKQSETLPTDISMSVKGDCISNNAEFVKALIAITLVAILVSICSRAIINFTIYVLGFGKHSTIGFTIVAIILTIILIIYILFILDDETSNSVKATLVGGGIVATTTSTQTTEQSS